jgi:hypothetical protein
MPMPADLQDQATPSGPRELPKLAVESLVRSGVRAASGIPVPGGHQRSQSANDNRW